MDLDGTIKTKSLYGTSKYKAQNCPKSKIKKTTVTETQSYDSHVLTPTSKFLIKQSNILKKRNNNNK